MPGLQDFPVLAKGVTVFDISVIHNVSVTVLLYLVMTEDMI